jgi:2-hydroxy-6-oxonona-2,4-dienedioate hydrolase
MTIMQRPLGPHGLGTRSQWIGWLLLAALALGMWLMMPVGSAGAAEDGSVAGLTPKFVDVNGVRTRYYEAGAGEPMVLVHGEGFSGHSSANAWSKNLAGLGKRFHVYAFDKLASGLTGNPRDDKDYNIQGEIEHAYQFIKTMGLGKVHLVGQSRGAGLVFFFAVAHPEMVRTLVMIDSVTASPVGPTTSREEAIGNCPKDPDWVEWRCRLRAISYLPDVAFDDAYFAAGRFMADQPKSHETVAKMKAGAGQPLRSQFNDWKKSVHERIMAQPVLMMPMLIYWGFNDPSAVLARGHALYGVVAKQNPKVRMFTVNQAGHFHFREYPDEFNTNVINFVDFWERPQSQ